MCIRDSVTAEADEVDVIGVPGQVERGGAMVQVGVGDEAKLLERFERAVDGRGGEGGAAVGTHFGGNRVGGRVPEPGERVNDAAPLRRCLLYTASCV